jgi:CBS domain-containing protein
MQVSCEHVMTRNPVTCRDSDNIMQAAQLMRDRHIGFIPIVDRTGKVSGVITSRDLCTRALAEGLPADTPLRRVMTDQRVVTIRPEDSLKLAEEKMIASGVGRVLVVDCDGRPVGVISRSDVALSGSSDRVGAVLGATTRRGQARQRAAVALAGRAHARRPARGEPH